MTDSGPPASACTAATLGVPYVDSKRLTGLPFGAHSHWGVPWRAYLETPPITTFLDGIGINLNFNPLLQSPELVVRMLASHGIRRARIEVGWGNISYADETKFDNNPAPFSAVLQVTKKYGIRPLILLNSHHGVPCPLLSFGRTVIAAAPAGATSLRLNDVSGLIPGYSGVSGLTTYWAAEALVTSVAGDTVTLSKPLPAAIAAGAVVPMATLKYRPFSRPGPDYDATRAGWKRYVDTVARFVAQSLGTTGQADLGFDMEIWNELTFGTAFLDINNYYVPPLYKWDSTSTWGNLLVATAEQAAATPADFAGVQLGDGFANTIPWSASTLEPLRIGAIDKHPYAGRGEYPRDDKQIGGGLVNVNAIGKVDTYVPTYRVAFPEYFGEALQTETMIRDLAPIDNPIYTAVHGRNARKDASGNVAPVAVWVTEVNENPAQDPSVTAAGALALKAKSALRYMAFFLNKGATQVDLFAAVDSDKGLGTVQENFLKLAAMPGATYPADDSTYTSPALGALGRLVARLKTGVATLPPSARRSLGLASLAACQTTVQWRGDGTDAHPDLRDLDVFAFLPFQVNARRFAILYYVMTRDYTKDLAPEQFTLEITGVSANAAPAAYDPIADKALPTGVVSRGPKSVTVNVTARDTPAVLFLDD